MGINEATDIFEREVISLINSTRLPMVNIELVLYKVSTTVHDLKLKAIQQEKELEERDKSIDGRMTEELNNEDVV